MLVSNKALRCLRKGHGCEIGDAAVVTAAELGFKVEALLTHNERESILMSAHKKCQKAREIFRRVSI